MKESNGSLALGQETRHKDEDAIVSKMVQQLKDQLEDLYSDKTTLRQVHSKMHGCVKAEFIVEKNLPAEYRVGIFKEARTFPSWIRFSNGNTKIQADKKKDTRGMAVKLMDVRGEKLLDSEKDAPTQDFVFAGSPIFFAKDLSDFHGLMTASISKNKLAIPVYFLSHLKIAIRTVTKLLLPCKHSLAIPYYSVTPYMFGDRSKTVKYVVKPSDKNVLEYTDETDFDYLRKNMSATLAKRDVYYDFFIQFQTDPVTMPIEDNTIEWTSPLIKVATIKIPKQVFDTPELKKFGENLTYNVWHSLPEHKPLGGFNRGRRKIYEELYKFRLDKNQVIQKEPEPTPDFLTV
jgi:catalase